MAKYIDLSRKINYTYSMEKISQDSSGPIAAREIIAEHWTYQTVLGLALAYLPDGLDLSADPQRWHQIIAELKDETAVQTPELLREVHFDNRSGGPVWSLEVDQFLFNCNFGAFEYPMPQTYRISEKLKRDLQERMPPGLRPHLGTIQSMSNRLQALAA